MKVGFALAALAVAMLAGPAQASDRVLLAALDDVPRVAAAAARADSGAGDAAQGRYDAARDLEEALRAAAPVSRGCRAALAAARAYARGHVRAAEGVDRLLPGLLDAGRAQARRARRRLGPARRRCHARMVRPARPLPELLNPRSGEVLVGAIRARAPREASFALLVVGRKLVATRPVRGGIARFPARAVPQGHVDLKVVFSRGRRQLRRASSRDVVSLGSAAAAAPRAAPEGAPELALATALEALGRRFDGSAAVWVHDLRTGRTAGWNEEARFPAASTVKLGVLLAALGRFGPRPERSPVAYDLEALAAWSSNLASNRLLERLPEGAVEHVFSRLGATGSTYPGPYRVGTSRRTGAPDPPPLVSARITTAHDLGRILFALHAAALGRRSQLAVSGLSRHEARVGLALLLRSRPVGENAGLLRPALPPGLPLAQKNGWIEDARHTAAILYTRRGPKIVVLLTYRPGLRRSAATQFGRAVLLLLSRTLDRPP